MAFDFLQRLLGRPKAEGEPPPVAARATHQGFEILARPIAEGGVWRVAGRIQRVGDDDGAGHEFVRADTIADHAEAVELSLLKARQLVDEQGARLLPDDDRG